jgi:glucans biosynthesis protein
MIDTSVLINSLKIKNLVVGFSAVNHLRTCLIKIFIITLCLFVAAPLKALTTEPPAESPNVPKRFTFADVRRRAETLAASAFAAPTDELPPRLQNLTYDQYRDIRFQPEKSLWREEGLPFEVQFFPRGSIFSKKVIINIVEAGEVKPFAYSNELFDFGHNPVPENQPADLGFGGFRLLYPLHQDNRYDEFAIFLGASYFRAIGQNQVWGLSARGLAINTGLIQSPEEFPIFREFWIVKPDKDTTDITVYALLDSPSVTGAYRFIIRPGRATTMEVKSDLFMRKAVEKLGVAPLTSMFFHGENTEVRVDDFRPKVHDSDGLLLATGRGEWIWRPLNNPAKLQISSFQDTNPHGFGLQQRDRSFDHYQDLESHYEKRPNAWVEPMGEWGKGIVQLVEIPSDSEKHDNIVAFWVADKPPEAGQELAYEYRVIFELEEAGRPPAGKTLATRIGAGGTADLNPGVRKFVLDFGGKTLEELSSEALVEAVISTSSGKIINTVVHKNEVTGGWRVFFELVPDGRNPAELRNFLKSKDDVLTETWSYHWEPR